MVDNAAMSSSEAREYMDKMKVRNLLVMCSIEEIGATTLKNPKFELQASLL